MFANAFYIAHSHQQRLANQRQKQEFLQTYLNSIRQLFPAHFPCFSPTKTSKKCFHKLLLLPTWKWNPWKKVKFLFETTLFAASNRYFLGLTKNNDRLRWKARTAWIALIALIWTMMELGFPEVLVRDVVMSAFVCFFVMKCLRNRRCLLLVSCFCWFAMCETWNDFGKGQGS